MRNRKWIKIRRDNFKPIKIEKYVYKWYAEYTKTGERISKPYYSKAKMKGFAKKHFNCKYSELKVYKPR